MEDALISILILLSVVACSLWFFSGGDIKGLFKDPSAGKTIGGIILWFLLCFVAYAVDAAWRAAWR